MYFGTLNLKLVTYLVGKMSDGIKKRGKAIEDQYFRDQEIKALAGLVMKASAKKSPISGQPMKTVIYEGVEIDICEESGGVWLDQGELEKIIENASKPSQAPEQNWLEQIKSTLGF